TLERRYLAASAAWRLTDIPTVSTEMAEIKDAARGAGDVRIEGRALIHLAKVALYRDADTEGARELAGRALDVVDEDDDRARFDALEVIGNASWWEGRLDEVERLSQERLALAERMERRDLQ